MRPTDFLSKTMHGNDKNSIVQSKCNGTLGHTAILELMKYQNKAIKKIGKEKLFEIFLKFKNGKKFL